jgi:hypothetical protein
MNTFLLLAVRPHIQSCVHEETRKIEIALGDEMGGLSNKALLSPKSHAEEFSLLFKGKSFK